MEMDHNLLFGVVATKLNLISLDQLSQVHAAWSAHKEIPLAEVLLRWGWLSLEDRQRVQRCLEIGAVDNPATPATTETLAYAPAMNSTLPVASPREDGQANQLVPQLRVMPVAGPQQNVNGESRYELCDLAGEGALGRVWLAEDHDLNREVALKEIRPDFVFDQDAVSRFLREAQVTGQLEHPNIVTVYELACRSDDGKPYYTMRFIRGDTLEQEIASYHERRQQGRADRLELSRLLGALISICHAVGYAHSRGVVHRDLKSSNVVLGAFGEVLVLDWGLAKTVDDEESPSETSVRLSHTSDARATQAGQIMGTPAFMAPEQAAGRLDLIDGRTDIYGLGGMLFEILTGQAPHEGDDVRLVLEHIIRGPVPQPRTLNAKVPAALNAICCKCLAKRKSARYASAAQVSEDLQRWLADEPVSVYREPWTTRLGRWMRRYRAWVSGGAAAAMVALITLSVSVVLLTASYEREHQAREDAVKNEGEAVRQSEIAQRNFEVARRAVDKYFTHVSEDTLLRQPGMQPLRHELLKLARGYYQDFLNDHRGNTSLRDELAVTLYRLGQITEDVESPESALPSFQQARELQLELLQDNPNSAELLADLGNTLNAIGGAWHQMQEFEQAVKSYRDAADIRRRVADDSPVNVEYQRRFANSLMNLGLIAKDQGLTEESDRQLQKAQEIRLRILEKKGDADDTRRDLGMGYYNQAVLSLTTGNTDKGERCLRNAVEAFETVLERNPQQMALQNRLSLCYRILGDIKRSLKAWDAAAELYQQALDRLEPLAYRNPDVPEYQSALAGVYVHLADVNARQRQNSAAVTYLNQAIEIYRPLAAEQRDVPQYRRDLAVSLRSLAVQQAAMRDLAHARASAEGSAELLKLLQAEYPDNKDYSAQAVRTSRLLEKLGGATPEESSAASKTEE